MKKYIISNTYTKELLNDKKTIIKEYVEKKFNIKKNSLSFIGCWTTKKKDAGLFNEKITIEIIKYLFKRFVDINIKIEKENKNDSIKDQ